MSNIQMVINKIISDKEFRGSLVDDPEETLRAAGITPTAEILAAFEGLDQATLKDLNRPIHPAC